ncbi:MAG: DUF5069 domain-containing protein [Candidatus Manganitrophus sp.]|nr:DUF5069 domain-containing protein [Candidatus Manganitrophus sp.]
MTSALRSPRERLGGYLLLPRLIDKVRLHAQGAPSAGVCRQSSQADGIDPRQPISLVHRA